MVAGAGFEPRDLRVMSPTSYLAALPRDNTAAFAKLYYSIKSPLYCQPFLHPFENLVQKISDAVRAVAAANLQTG